MPALLIKYLQVHESALSPEIRSAWETAGAKSNGSWQQIFGNTTFTDDLFMAWHFATYLNAVTAAGKAEYPIPMFVNAALIRPNYLPGQYNSGGPLPHSFDIWHAAAPNVDLLCLHSISSASPIQRIDWTTLQSPTFTANCTASPR